MAGLQLSARVRRTARATLQLANDSGGVEPRLLATNQAVADVEHVQYPEANWRSAALDADERAADMAGGDRLVGQPTPSGDPESRP